MLQNSRVTAFTVFELLRENQLGGKITPPPPFQIRVKCFNMSERDKELDYITETIQFHDFTKKVVKKSNIRQVDIHKTFEK